MDDLISRKAVVDTIYKRDERLQRCEIYRNKGDRIDLLGVLPEIYVIPPAFHGMTNGEVMQAVYTDSEIEIDETMKIVTIFFGADEDYCEEEVSFDLDWWNKPYKIRRRKND